MNAQLYFILALLIGLLTGFFVGYMWFSSHTNKKIETLEKEIEGLKNQLQSKD